MANRFPLVIDTSDGNKIKEIPIGDSIDLDNVGLANLQTLSVQGTLSGANINTTDAATIGGSLSVTGPSTFTGDVGATAINTASLTATGTVEAAAITIGGANVQVPVQSDWTEADPNSLAFILNKPASFGVDSLNDIGDVFVSSASVNQVLTFDGLSWYAGDVAGFNPSTDITLNYNLTPSGYGYLDYDSAGTFTWTPPLIPRDTADLTNGAGYTTAAFVTSQGYLTTSNVQGGGRITTSVAGNTVNIGFDDSGLLTQEVDTLQTVTGRGASTDQTITALSFNQGATSTITSVIRLLEVEQLTINSGLSTISGDFDITTTNGLITATNGSVTSATITATSTLNTPLVQNIGGNIRIDGDQVILEGPMRLAQNLNTQITPSSGDLNWDGMKLEIYTNDNGTGNAGWMHITGDPQQATRGFILPAFTTTGRNGISNPANGETILNITTGSIDVYTGPTNGWLSATLS